MPKRSKTQKVQKKYHDISKEDFLKVLTSLDKDQIQEFILSKGKEPKMITPVMILND